MNELTAKQLQAIHLLSVGTSITETAEKVGLARATIHRWLKDNDMFLAHLNSLKSEQLESARTQIQASCGLAINTLVDVMEKSTNENARINAACKVLEMSGLTKDTLNMYAWGIGGTTIEKVRADKKADAILEKYSELGFSL